MSDKSAVEFVEEWQTGALVLFGVVFSGIVVAALLGQFVSVAAGVAGFVVGAVGAFLLFAYLRYGR